MRAILHGAQVVTARERSYVTKAGQNKTVGEAFVVLPDDAVPVKVAHPTEIPLSVGELVDLEVSIRPGKFGGLDCWVRQARPAVTAKG